MMDFLAAAMGASTNLVGVIVALGLAAQIPEAARRRPAAPRSARILPFVRRPGSRPQPPPDRPLLVSIWRSRRNRDGGHVLELHWSLAPRLPGHARANRRGMA